LFKQTCLQKYIDKLNKILSYFLFLIITGSIVVGIYLVFFAFLGKEVSWQTLVPLHFLLLDISNITSVQFNLGIIFISFWLVYLIVYFICASKPVPLFNNSKDERSSKHNFKILDLNPSNSLYIAIQWFSGYFLLSVVIDLVQQLFGIHIGNPLVANPLLSFFNLTISPLNEEILFRVIFLGIPLSLIFFSFKNSFISCLTHPSKNLSVKSNLGKNVVLLFIFANSVFFGLSHVVFGGNYEVGKITQASLGGLFLGWLYYRYGLGTSIIFHWISNYVLFSYGLLGFLFFNSSWTEESNNYFLMPISVAFIILGFLFLYKNSRKFLERLSKIKKEIT
jgi:hypothetical protein